MRLIILHLRAGLAATLFHVISTVAAPPDFNREIRPLLADHCFHCHGPDEQARKSGLRLDLREAALKGGTSDGPAIVPGKPEQSALIARLITTSADDLMPPPKEKHPVKPEAIEQLKRWIADGAPYAKHWSFEQPVKSPAPSAGKTTSPIDAFVQAKLRKVGLAPSPPATPEQICRRLHLDITGLPPSPGEVAAFVKAARRDLHAAAGALADRLLRSEHFGEKWARHWLDAARYADSNGYEKDLPREQWAWRDWVIQSINSDQPYNQFLIEQIAGDLLPNRTPGQLIATGFLRNGMINEEGAIVPEQFRMEGNFDRIDTLGKSVLGLTLQCAQCHTHKFDPISHTEYYGLFAFLNNTHDAQSWVYSEQQQKKIDEILAGIVKVERRIRDEFPDWEQRMARWEAEVQRELDKTEWTVVEAEDMHTSTELNHPTSLPDKSILTLGHRTSAGDVYLTAQPKVDGITGLRLEILKHGDLPFFGPGRSRRGTWALTELIIEAKPPGSNKWEQVKMTQASSDYSEPELPMDPPGGTKPDDKTPKRTRGPVSFLVDGSDLTAWRADRGLGRCNTESVAVVQFEKPWTLPEGTKLKISLRQNHNEGNDAGQNTMVGRFRVSLTKTPAPKAPPVAYAAILAMRTPRAERTAIQKAELFTAWRQSVPELQTAHQEIEALWKQYPEAMTSVLHLAERGPEDPRETARLDRGQWDRPKERVVPQVPAALHPLKDAQSSPRLAFARWLADDRSPLTARVMVNRAWQAMFGMGLVETAEDFGLRGAEPIHHELLDWLAVDFMENGWSQKRLIRSIVTSSTYLQSSRSTPQLMERDPRNTLLARGPRFRADAEVVRDVALSASGLLSTAVGGPSIFPPVPQNVLDINFVGVDYWIPAKGPDRYRRSLYVFRKRSMPDPALATFDAPNGDTSCARRMRSNTPLAALASLNETIFVEASQALALRILREGGFTDAERADYAYRLCTGRAAKPAERAEILKLITTRRKQLSEGWLQSQDIAAVGSAQGLPARATPRDAAAWTIAARVLLNLDETLSKN